MMILSLAYRNIKGAGLRTWLNVAVLSLSYVLIIWTQGFFEGMNRHATRAMIDEEIGGGQYWYKEYDPYDFLSIDESHAPIPDPLMPLIRENKAAAVLVRQAAIYPGGRIQSVLLKGIDPAQTILKIPSEKLKAGSGDLPLLIGARMSKNTSLKVGDFVTIRWRDSGGTFDAIEGKVVWIMRTTVPGIDNGQLWLPLKELQKMTRLDGEATLITVDEGFTGHVDAVNWEFRDHDFLLRDIRSLVQTKKVSSSIMYIILLFLALIAVFDTQVFAVFRRTKEIGTLIALGMTRGKVILLFTLEGAMHGFLALLTGAVYGTPLLIITASYGIGIPQAAEGFGFALSDRLFPVYGVELVLATVFLIMVAVTIVSYLPSSKIAKLKPTDAIRGKVS